MVIYAPLHDGQMVTCATLHDGQMVTYTPLHDRQMVTYAPLHDGQMVAYTVLHVFSKYKIVSTQYIHVRKLTFKLSAIITLSEYLA